MGALDYLLESMYNKEEEVTHDFWEEVIKSFADSRKVENYSRNDEPYFSHAYHGRRFYSTEPKKGWLAIIEKSFTSLKSKLEEIFSPENISSEMSGHGRHKTYKISCTSDIKYAITIADCGCGIFLDFYYSHRVSVNYVLDDDVPLMNVVEIFRDLKNEYDANCEKLEKLLLEVRKAEKIKEMAEISIENMLKKIFASCAAKGNSYKYNLEKEDTSIVLQVKLRHKKMVEIMLPHKNFAEKIKQLPEQLKKIEQFLEELSLPINIKTYDNDIKWLEV